MKHKRAKKSKQGLGFLKDCSNDITYSKTTLPEAQTNIHRTIFSLDTIELPKLSRPSPRCPEFLFNHNCSSSVVASSILESIPHEHKILQESCPRLFSTEDSFSSVKTQAINTHIIKPNDWKLLPPSAFDHRTEH